MLLIGEPAAAKRRLREEQRGLPLRRDELLVATLQGGTDEVLARVGTRGVPVMAFGRCATATGIASLAEELRERQLCTVRFIRRCDGASQPPFFTCGAEDRPPGLRVATAGCRLNRPRTRHARTVRLELSDSWQHGRRSRREAPALVLNAIVSGDDSETPAGEDERPRFPTVRSRSLCARWARLR